MNSKISILSSNIETLMCELASHTLLINTYVEIRRKSIVKIYDWFFYWFCVYCSFLFNWMIFLQLNPIRMLIHYIFLLSLILTNFFYPVSHPHHPGRKTHCNHLYQKFPAVLSYSRSDSPAVPLFGRARRLFLLRMILIRLQTRSSYTVEQDISYRPSQSSLLHRTVRSEERR